MFCTKILFFFKGWYEKIVKRGDALGGILNNNDNLTMFYQNTDDPKSHSGNTRTFL